MFFGLESRIGVDLMLVFNYVGNGDMLFATFFGLLLEEDLASIFMHGMSLMS
jgi:hypothetical protein